MSNLSAEEQGQHSQLRLLLEELCCELCRFEHASLDRAGHGEVGVVREYYLGNTGEFADI